MTQRTEIQTERLRTLSRELRNVKPEAFDMLFLNKGDPSKLGCGSTACAIGHCPVFFPGDWRFDYLGGHIYAELIEASSSGFRQQACEYFGLEMEIACDLFDPEDSESYGMPIEDITPSDVANRIDALLAETQP